MSLHPKPRDLDTIRTADPVELASRVIDSGVADEPTNRVTNRLSEIDDTIAVVESFSHLLAFRTDDGLVCFDASGPMSGAPVVEALRGWTSDRVSSLVYTHGHIDHVGGSGAVMADADDRGVERPSFIGHTNVAARFERYDATNGYNLVINARQFGGVSRRHGVELSAAGERFLPEDTAWPDVTYDESMTLEVGGLAVELHHDRGETDDHTWAWIPHLKALCVGDLVTWVFPNAGNPQKVQRYPLDWARALRRMQTFDADLLLPAHGLPVRGEARIDEVLGTAASALEGLVDDTLAMMNAGDSLDTIVNTVRVPDELLARPWLQPVYDEPEFVVRNIWRQFGGWWDANPAHLKPATEAALGRELVALAGGVAAVVARAEELADAGEHRLGCHLIELAVAADPESMSVHGARAEIYQARRDVERSLMSKGIFAAASRESRAVLDD